MYKNILTFNSGYGGIDYVPVNTSDATKACNLPSAADFKVDGDPCSENASKISNNGNVKVFNFNLEQSILKKIIKVPDYPNNTEAREESSQLRRN